MNDVVVPPPPTKSPRIESKIPITIFTGFLGSGKTTIITHLLEELKDKEKIVYIKNEDGDSDIDAQLIAEQKIVAQDMLNGCVCCTLVGPLLSTISELIEQHNPDRIILESSGTAEPANLAVTLSGHPQLFRDGMISIIDAAHYDLEPEFNDHYHIQSRVTDLLILNKVEEVNAEQKQHVIDTLRRTNSYSPIVEARQGRISPDLVFGIPTTIKQIQVKEHTHHNSLESFSIDLPQSIDLSSFKKFLEAIPESVIRIKGVVLTPEPIIVNQAYKRKTFTKPSRSDNYSKGYLYFIGKNIVNTHQSAITSLAERIMLSQ